MSRLRRVIAAGLLVACLVLALPGSAEAWAFDRGDRDRAVAEVEAEATFWQQLWHRFQSFWLKSVLIDPMGGDLTGPPGAD